MRRDSTGRRPPVEPFRLLALGVLLLGLPWIGALPALPPGDGMAGGVAAALWIASSAGGLTFGFLWRAWELLALPVLAGAALIGVFLLQAEREATAEVVADVSASSLPSAPVSVYYQVSDAHLERRLQGLALTDPQSADGRPAIGRAPIGYCVLPIVGPGWRPTQPVPGWAVGYLEGEKADWPLARSACPNWADDRQILRRPTENGVFAVAPEGIAAAIRDALSRHGLRTPELAPILFPRADVQTGLGQRGVFILAAAVALQVLGLAWIIVAWRRRAVRTV